MPAAREEKAAAGEAAVGTREREHQGCAHQDDVAAAAAAADACSAAGAVGVAACTLAVVDDEARSRRHHLGGAAAVDAAGGAADAVPDTYTLALQPAQACALPSVTRLPAPAAADCCPWSAEDCNSPAQLTQLPQCAAKLELTTFEQLMSCQNSCRELRFDCRSEALACVATSCLSAPSERAESSLI
eukprot:13213-Heterococcus_DN1.PRE.1